MSKKNIKINLILKNGYIEIKNNLSNKRLFKKDGCIYAVRESGALAFVS